MIRILAIETSCDETAAAIVQDGQSVLSSVVASQVDLHARYGGVFPELASRLHVQAIVPIVQQAMEQAQLSWADLDAIAVTYGPGLAGSLVVGVNAAKGIALARQLPLIGVNHLEGHIYAHWLHSQGDGQRAEELVFPLLFLIVSGGHTELVVMCERGQYELVGQTLDDAAGEAFDKVARLLGLGYPGGPAIEMAAQRGSPAAFYFARPKVNHPLDLSFSGIKTAVLRVVQARRQAPGPLPVDDIAASFQASVIDQLSDRAVAAAQQFGVTALLLAGGVSANRALRTTLQLRCPVPVYWPTRELCTDNAAMIGAAAFWHYQAGEHADWDLDVEPGLRLA